MARGFTKRRPPSAFVFTQEQVTDSFAYDAVTGGLRWLVRTGSRSVIGKLECATERHPYAYVSFSRRKTPLHHLVWFYHKGRWPTEYLIFKDGDSKNTRIENLQESTASIVQKKLGAKRVGTSGIKGLAWDPERNHWRVSWRGKYFGGFEERAEALVALEVAKLGKVLSPKEKQKRLATKMARIRLRAVWRSVLSTSHTWSSFEHFLQTVKDRPGPKTFLRVKVAGQLLGPENFEWGVVSALDIKRRAKEKREANYEDYRDKWISKKFGVPRGWYRSTLELQNGACAICKQPETRFRQGRLLPLAVDHDHLTGNPRGLLCTSCNIGIGSLKDDPDVLKEAAAYVQRFRKEHTTPLPDNVVSLRGKPA